MNDEKLARAVAVIMEPEPPMMPLHAIRQQRDGDYNVSERTSNGGWWIAQTGSDAGKGSDFCKWEPKDATEDPAAALGVLKRCAEGRTVTVEFTTIDTPGKPQWMVAELVFRGGEYVEEKCAVATTLETAICAFSKKLFSK